MNRSENSAKGRQVNPLAEHEIGMTWKRTLEYIEIDFERLVENFGNRGTFPQRLYWRLLPSFQAIFWYRVCRCLYIKGWRQTGMLLSLISQYVTTAEIPPQSSIGPGLFIGHAPCVVLAGRIGKNCSIYGVAGVGGGYGTEDIGGGRGLPVLGDNVTMAHLSMAQGPIRIGNDVKFGPHAHVTRDVPDGAIIIAPGSRIQRTAASSGDSTTAGPAVDVPAEQAVN